MNQFDEFTWPKVLKIYPKRPYSIEKYHEILGETPSFLEKYLSLPLMTRLKDIGLLCGTDWTKLYKNRFYYSRFHHSVGVALIIWHFTHDKKQTLAGLFHDVSTPLFSHVSDFQKGDALTQSATEEPNSFMIKNDPELARLLAQDNLTPAQVCDYHLYPVADNEIPQLSADRLEYMFPSGMALEGSWTLDEIKKVYDDISVLKNEEGIDELGFNTLECAELYAYRFAMTGHLLQLNENKLTLQLLAEITNSAIDLNIISSADCLYISEKNAMNRFETYAKAHPEDRFSALYRTFRNMEEIEHTQEKQPDQTHFCVNLKVKQRYINPLVIDPATKKPERLSKISEKTARLISDFLTYQDTPWGCVRLQ